MAGAGSIFLNYRREESQWVARLLHDRLAATFGKDRVFTDVDGIGPGQDFTKVLAAAVGKCSVLLAIIGPGWTNVIDEAGRRRLENPHDWVRFEIETALGRADVLVIPVLTDNAPMPQARELPGELAQLSLRQAFKITADGFSRDAEELIKYLQDIVNPPATRPGPEPGPYIPHPHPPATPSTSPLIAVTSYPALPEDLQWSMPGTGSVVVERVAVRAGAWVKIGDPLFFLRGNAGIITLWSTFMGQVQAVAYQPGQALLPGQPMLTLAVSGWLMRANGRMPFDTGVLLMSGAPSRLEPAGTASRLLTMVDRGSSRPVPWNASCLLYVPVGNHVFSAIYELGGAAMATANEKVKIRRGQRVTLSYGAPKAKGANGTLYT